MLNRLQLLGKIYNVRKETFDTTKITGNAYNKTMIRGQANDGGRVIVGDEGAETPTLLRGTDTLLHALFILPMLP